METRDETAAVSRARIRTEVWREGVTMALYIALSQLAVMTALSSQDAAAQDNLAIITLMTSVGLILAHQVAFRLSSRLVAEGSRLEAEAPRVLAAQLVGGGVVTAIAVLPIAIFGSTAYRWSIALLLLFVMIVGYAAARSAPVSRIRALVYVGFVFIVVVGVLFVKSFVTH